MTFDSLVALAHTFLEELERKGSNPLHELTDISCTLQSLPNGIKHCSVQIQCKSGFGWLVESYGQEAHLLRTRAKVIHNMLTDGPMTSPELIGLLFPEIDTQPRILTREPKFHDQRQALGP